MQPFIFVHVYIYTNRELSRRADKKEKERTVIAEDQICFQLRPLIICVIVDLETLYFLANILHDIFLGMYSFFILITSLVVSLAVATFSPLASKLLIRACSIFSFIVNHSKLFTLLFNLLPSI